MQDPCPVSLHEILAVPHITRVAHHRTFLDVALMNYHVETIVQLIRAIMGILQSLWDLLRSTRKQGA